MKSNWKDWMFLAAVLFGIGMVIYSVYNISGSPEATEWLAKSWSKATMKDVLATGGILVTMHALLTRP